MKASEIDGLGQNLLKIFDTTNQLKGDEIILESRILAVADVVEAMTSHRPYRPALGIEVALQEIESGKGKKYDTRVVDICISLFRDEGFSFSSDNEV